MAHRQNAYQTLVSNFRTQAASMRAHIHYKLKLLYGASITRPIARSVSALPRQLLHDTHLSPFPWRTGIADMHREGNGQHPILQDTIIKPRVDPTCLAVREWDESAESDQLPKMCEPSRSPRARTVVLIRARTLSVTARSTP